jgi:hypothetical protein
MPLPNANINMEFTTLDAHTWNALAFSSEFEQKKTHQRTGDSISFSLCPVSRPARQNEKLVFFT